MPELTHFYVEQNTAQTTSSTVPSIPSGMSISGGDLTANNKYLIIARALIGVNGVTDLGRLNIVTADDIVIATKSLARVEFQQTGSADLLSYLFVQSYTTDASPADVQMEFAISGGSTMTADQMSLLLLDLDAIGTEGTDYFEDINAATGSEIADDGATPPADWTDLATLTSANLGTDTYWILGHCSIGVGSGGRFFRVEARGADDAASIATLGVHQAEGEDTNERRNVGFSFRHHATTATDVIIRAQEEAASGNMTDQGSYLIALPTSLFADFEHDYQAGAIVIDGTETTIATTGSYTPTITGNHLVFGRSQGSATPTALGGMWVESTTTEIRTGDSTPTHNQIWDSAKDEEQQITFQRYAITTAETFNLRSQGAGTDFDQEDRWLIVVNLNEPSVAAVYPPFPRRQRTTVRM